MHRFLFIAFCGLLVLLSSIIGCQSKTAETATRDPSASPNSDSGTGSEAGKKEPITLLLNWYPEAEHGGYYAAMVHGYYAEEGLEVTIRPGGRSVVVAPELTLGRVQFGIGNADDVLMSRSEDAKIVALMAPLQNGPRSIMVREDSGIQSFQDLKNVKLQIDSGRPYIPFLKQKGLLDASVQVVPYFGSVAELVAGPGVAQQAYSFSEPLMAEEQGVRVRNLMMSDIGYNPYACCLVTSESYLQKSPAVVQKMVRASIKGWLHYLRDPQKTNAYILQQNKEGMTEKALAFGAQQLKDLCQPNGLPENRFGEMTLERWQTLRDQLVDLKLIKGEQAIAAESFRWELSKE